MDAQPYKYNGKELDKMHGLNLYDYSARYYESAIGRFTTIDPHAENYYSWSPYHYAANNPIRITDPTGMDWYMSLDSTSYIHYEGSEERDGYINIGATYDQKIGNTTYHYTQNEVTGITYTGIMTQNWVSQISSKINCYQASERMLSNVGVTSAG